jgi:hypothetical protein
MWVLFCSRERTAMADGPSGEAPPRHVEIKMVSREEDRALTAVLSELLDRLQVTTRFTTIPDLANEEMWKHADAPAAVARAWIDLREPGQVTLYLTGDHQDRVLVRQVPLVRNLDEVAREEIAHIVEAAVDELLLGGQIGVEKKHDQDLPPTVKLPPPLPEPPLRLDIGFGYAAQGWHLERAPLHGPAGFVSLAKTTGPWRPGAWLSAEVRFPVTVKQDDNPVQMTLNQGAVRLLFTADRSLSSRWIVRGGIGGGFDWINVVLPSPSESSNIEFLGGTRVVPMLRALALARYAFAAKSEIFFGLAGDLDVGRTHYLTETSPGQTREFLYPLWLRPMALIGITADVLAY